MRVKKIAGLNILVGLAFVAAENHAGLAAQEHSAVKPVAAFILPRPDQPDDPIKHDATPSPKECRLTSGPTRLVSRIIDAHTLRLDDGSELVLSDIYTLPRYQPTIKGAATDPQKHQTEDIKFLKELTLGKAIKLKFDRKFIDRYGRRTAHVYTVAGGKEIWIQAEMIKHGYAMVASGGQKTTRHAIQNCIKLLLKQEASARIYNRGHWGTHLFEAKSAGRSKDLAAATQTFQLIEGRVRRISENNGRLYLNFGRNWKNDFTISLNKRVLKLLKMQPVDIAGLKGKYIRVRGWIENSYGPMIRLRRPGDLEIIAKPPRKNRKKIPGTINRTGYP